MHNYKIPGFVAAIAGLLLAVAGCSKVVTGYLSTNVFYLENPLTTSQGSITVSSAMETDGSTTPMTVILKKVVDANGNDVDSVLRKTDSIMGFTGSVSYLDSTLTLLNAKLATTAAQPLSVNPVGGRIQLTPATQYVPTGTYTIDVQVTNARGTEYIPNACQIIINGSGSVDTVYGGTYAGTFDPASGTYLNGLNTPTISVQYTPNVPNKIVYKFIDKNGLVYNPLADGITVRTDRWTMKQFDPYYPEVLTDTSVEYQFPVVPNQFPVFINPGVNGVIPRGNYGVFPAIPQAHNDSGYPIFVFLDMSFFAQGQFEITINWSDVAWQ